MRIAIIPARGGSVRLPRKNIRPFWGRPVIAYSIETARACGLFDHIIVSTDDEEIAAVAQRHGADSLMRPEGYADKGTQDIGRLVVEQLSMAPRHACVIYATAPLLVAGDLENGWAALNGGTNVFSMGVGSEPLRDAGAFYWGETWAFAKEVPLIGPRTAMVPIPEHRVCDVNTAEDWIRCERLYAAIHQEGLCAAS